MPPRRVVHLIGNLRTGGAETMLLKLVQAHDRSAWQPVIISLVGEGSMAEKLRAAGAQVTALGGRKRSADPRLLLRVWKALRAAQPDIVHAWMYHSCLLAALARGMSRRPPLIWSIRTSARNRRAMPGMTQATLRACAMLSGRVDAVVYNAERSRANHRALGFHPRREEVIPNGFDLEVFRPDPKARAAVRAELELAHDTPLVGIFGRVHHDKRHDVLLDGMRHILEVHPGARLLAVGEWTDDAEKGVHALAPTAEVRAACIALGERTDIAQLMAACDVIVCSSDDEGFSNAVGEALACGVPQVVTDVGDNARIIGDAGEVVPPGDPATLGAAVARVLSLSTFARAALGEDGRTRASANFALAAVARQHEALYTAVLSPPARQIA